MLAFFFLGKGGLVLLVHNFCRLILKIALNILIFGHFVRWSNIPIGYVFADRLFLVILAISNKLDVIVILLFVFLFFSIEIVAD
jgi:hypothetical protein